MGNRKLLPVAAAALCVMLAACASVEEAPDGSKSSALSGRSGSTASPIVSSGNGPTHIKKELATNLSVDADFVMPRTGTGQADVLTAKFHSADTDALLQRFFSGKTVKSHDGEDGDVYQATDGSYLNNSLGSFTFSDSGKPNINYSFFVDQQNLLYYNGDKFSTTSDLPFESRESAAEKIRKTLSSFGVNVGENYICYSLDHQTLKIQQDEYVRKEKEDATNAKYFEEDLKAGRIKLQKEWTQNEDCYYFIFQPEINGIPVTRQLHGSADNGTEVEGTDITVLYSKNGIVDLSSMYVYDKTGVATEDALLLNTDKVLDAINEKYTSLILSDPITVTKISLSYVPVLMDKSRQNFRLMPAWEITVRQTYQKPDKAGKMKINYIDSTAFFDAVTGKEIS